MEARKHFLRSIIPPSVGCIALALAITCLSAHEELVRGVTGHLHTIAALRTAQVRAVLTGSMERLLELAGEDRLCLAARELQRTHSTRHHRRVDSILTDAAESIRSFRDIVLLDSDGTVLAATDTSLRGSSWASHPCFAANRQALDTSGIPCAYLSAPLLVDSESVGMLIAKADAAELIRMVVDSTGLGRTGEALLVLAETPERARILTPLRLDSADASPHVVGLRDKHGALLRRVIGTRSLLSKGVDYRGKRVLAASQFIDPPGWRLLVKMDTAEAYEPSIRLAVQGLVMLLGALFVMIAVSARLSRDITQPLESMTFSANCGEVGDFRTPFKHDWPVAELATLGMHCDNMREFAGTTFTEQNQDVMRLRRRNQLLRAQCAIDRLIIRESNLDRLLRGTCDILSKTTSYDTAWTMLVDENGKRTAVAFGGNIGYPAEILIELIADNVPRCALESVPADEPGIYRETDSVCVECPFGRRIRNPFHMMVHLVANGRVRGCLCVAMPRRFLDSHDEREVFADIARDLSQSRLFNGGQ